MKRLIPVIALLSIAATIQMDITPETPKRYPLQIVCPISQQAIYYCNIEELYWDEPLESFLNENTCLPVNSSIPPIKNGEGIIFPCPTTDDRPIRILKEFDPEMRYQTIQLFTNKGWMPKRRRS